MKTLIAIALIGAAGSALFLASQSRRSATRYRVTVTINTPEGERAGSSVLEATSQRKLLHFEGIQITTDLHGEAVVVDLPGRGMLVAMLYSEGSLPLENLIGKAWQMAGQEGRLSTGEAVPMRRFLKPGTAGPGKSASGYPMLVHFADPSNPDTVTKVDPGDLAATFGPGVSLRSITITIVNAPITRHILTTFPWLAERNGTIRRGGPIPTSPAERPLNRILHNGYFYQGAEYAHARARLS